jgi:GNAT superfamily N-acetyltransferase
MWWRLPGKELNARKGEGNRRAMQQIVESGEVPGLLAYDDGQPVGWCAVAPRESFPRFERSVLLKRIDQQPVWSIVCFYVARSHRRQGVMSTLIDGASPTFEPGAAESSRRTRRNRNACTPGRCSCTTA